MNLWLGCPKWHSTFTAVPSFLNYFYPTSISIMWRIFFLYTYIWLFIDCCYKIILRVEHSYNNWERCWQDIYHWGAGVAVTGRIRDTGQNVLLSYFQTASTSNLFFFMAFYADVFIWNIINIIWIHFTVIITIFISYNNAIINNDHGRLQESVLLFKIFFGIWNDFFKICRQSGHAPSTMLVSPPYNKLHPAVSCWEVMHFCLAAVLKKFSLC